MDVDAQARPLGTGRAVHVALARALRDGDPGAGADSQPPGATRECLERAAASGTYHELLARPRQVEDTFALWGHYTGVIDAWYEADQQCAAAFDWKTGAAEAKGYAHRIQRLVYALALLAHYQTVSVTTVNIGAHPWPDEVETFARSDISHMRSELTALSQAAPQRPSPAGNARPASAER